MWRQCWGQSEKHRKTKAICNIYSHPAISDSGVKIDLRFGAPNRPWIVVSFVTLLCCSKMVRGKCIIFPNAPQKCFCCRVSCRPTLFRCGKLRFFAASHAMRIGTQLEQVIHGSAQSPRTPALSLSLNYLTPGFGGNARSDFRKKTRAF